MEFVRRTRLTRDVIIAVNKMRLRIAKLKMGLARQKSQQEYGQRKQAIPKRKKKC